MVAQLHFMVGVAGSGKSTFANEQVRKLNDSGTKSIVVSADNYPGLYKEGALQCHLLMGAHANCLKQVCSALELGLVVYLDNTNLNTNNWMGYLDFCSNNKIPVYFHVPIDRLLFYTHPSKLIQSNRIEQLNHICNVRSTGDKIIPLGVICQMESNFYPIVHTINKLLPICSNNPEKWINELKIPK